MGKITFLSYAIATFALFAKVAIFFERRKTIMSEYQLEIKQIVDYPRCRIYRQFIQMLLAEKNIRVGGTSGLFYYTVLCCYANFRTSYKRIDGISYTIRPGEWLCRISEVSDWFRTRFHHQAVDILKELQGRHLITYTILGRGKLVKFKINGWARNNRVLDYNAPCQKESGFFFLPISTANELVGCGKCSEMDALLDTDEYSAIGKFYPLQKYRTSERKRSNFPECFSK